MIRKIKMAQAVLLVIPIIGAAALASISMIFVIHWYAILAVGTLTLATAIIILLRKKGAHWTTRLIKKEAH